MAMLRFGDAMIDIRKITIGEWFKIVGFVAMLAVAYNTIGIHTDKLVSHDKQINYLQGANKGKDTEIALIKQRQEMQDREYKELGEKLERDRIKSEELNREINNTLSQLQVSIAKLNATMDQILANKKGR
ncbi:hypothetical protein HQ400_07895 [Aeromonas jandaei]|nr:hypothetical protein HQ400_07895 [Aeromonas jandaei]